MLMAGRPCKFGTAYIQVSYRALPLGPQRDHFLALALPANMEKLREDHPEVFPQASYGVESSVAMNYHPSAAWACMVCDQEQPKVILFNDI
jgi:hypothetical protein